MTNQVPQKALMSVPEAADMLGCSQRMIRKLVQTRQVPFVRIGRLVRFRRSDIDRYITTNTQRPMVVGFEVVAGEDSE